MPTDISGPLKVAVISHLEGDAVLTAIVPVARLYGMQMPAKPRFPYIRYGSPVTTGYEATCWDGAAVRVTLHAFAETSPSGAGEDKAANIAALIVERMKTFAPAGLGIIENEWVNTNLIRDEPEADRWHAITEFSITAVRA
ncbi:DUF3168 domain-containing protein [Mesorhizobium sp. M0938]|uniref:DUF3168 domain-containing protein n=1 Tax=unclassified Mesorhizobium TaxID=325217 RepID=UPI003337D75D